MKIGRDNRGQKRRLEGRPCVLRHQRRDQGWRFPGREGLDPLSPCLEIRSVMAWGSPHLASQSNQVNLLHTLIGITCGVDVELRPDTERPGGDVGSNSKSDILLGRFE